MFVTLTIKPSYIVLYSYFSDLTTLTSFRTVEKTHILCEYKRYEKLQGSCRRGRAVCRGDAGELVLLVAP